MSARTALSRVFLSLSSHSCKQRTAKTQRGVVPVDARDFPRGRDEGGGEGADKRGIGKEEDSNSIQMFVGTASPECSSPSSESPRPECLSFEELKPRDVYICRPEACLTGITPRRSLYCPSVERDAPCLTHNWHDLVICLCIATHRNRWHQGPYRG